MKRKKQEGGERERESNRDREKQQDKERQRAQTYGERIPWGPISLTYPLIPLTHEAPTTIKVSFAHAV